MVNIGDKFGKLTVLEFAGVTGGSHSSKIYHCKCECGEEKDVQSYLLTSKRVQSCGCLRKEDIKAKGEVNTKNHTNIGLIKKRSVRGSNPSGVAGVYKHKCSSLVATITLQGKRKYLGFYNELDDAINVRREAEKELFDKYLEEQ